MDTRQFKVVQGQDYQHKGTLKAATDLATKMRKRNPSIRVVVQQLIKGTWVNISA